MQGRETKEMKEGEGHSGHETLYTLPRTLADLLLSKGGAPPTPGTAPRGSLTFLIPTRCEVSTVQSGDAGSSAERPATSCDRGPVLPVRARHARSFASVTGHSVA